MKTIVAACVPSVHVYSLLNSAFQVFGIHAKAFKTRPTSTPLVEHLPCPIEPTTKASLWIEVHGEVNTFLSNTFLNEEFVTAVISDTANVDDKMAMECLMAACAARAITIASTDTKTMLKSAQAAGSDRARRHLAENILGIPSLTDLLMEFVDSVVAGTARNRYA